MGRDEVARAVAKTLGRGADGGMVSRADFAAPGT
eukprot:gene26048-56295_t